MTIYQRDLLSFPTHHLAAQLLRSQSGSAWHLDLDLHVLQPIHLTCCPSFQLHVGVCVLDVSVPRAG